MLQKEFENLTKFEVSTKEFEAIHEVYMRSDLEKEEFCRAWCKMNKNRIKFAKDAQKEDERIRKANMTARKVANKYLKLYEKLHKVAGTYPYIQAFTILSAKDMELFKMNDVDVTVCIDTACYELLSITNNL